MIWLLATNILLRWVDRQHSVTPTVDAAIAAIRFQGGRLVVTAQNLVELWNVATRPAERNGFGMTHEEADRLLTRLELWCEVLPDDPEVYAAWRRLVVQYHVKGVQVHDTRLVAAMHVHGVSHLLTLNAGDFRRFSSIQVRTPTDLTAPSDPAT